MQVIKDLDTEKAKHRGGSATAKEVLLDALRLDRQNIARTARAIDAKEPRFADKFQTPGSPSQSALLTAADAFVLELDKAGVAAKIHRPRTPCDVRARPQRRSPPSRTPLLTRRKKR